MRREVPEGGGSTRGARVPTLKRRDDRRSPNLYEMHKRETGDMSGNAPRVVKQLSRRYKKRVKNGGPPETLRTSRHHRVRPEEGEDWGGSKQEGGGRAEPPKNRRKRSGKKPRSGKNHGAVKTAER